jgi:P pilus assembly chaperone PapD
MNVTLLPLRRALAILALLAAPVVATAQVSITPTRLILAPSDRTGDITVLNPTAQPMVVSTRMFYSIYRSDSTGDVRLDTVRTGDPMERSALEWTRLFPKQFTLQPGEKRVVRVMVTPPNDLGDGEYIARVGIRGVPVDRPVSVASDTNAVKTDVSLNLSYSVPVLFRKGKLTTGVAFDVKEIFPRDGRSWVKLGLKTTGNATFRGTLRVTVLDAAGKIVAKKDHALISEVGYDYPLEIPTLPAGSYTLSMEAITELPGKANESVVKGAPTMKQIAINVTGKSVTLASSN